MMYQGILLGLCIGLSLSGSAYGDLKVLFTFDDSGIEALRVVEIAASGENYPATVAELPASPQGSMVMMKWMGASGQILAVTQIFDPRVTSSPEHINPSSVSRVGLIEGAWVGEGPDDAEVVVVEFPQNIALGLDLETWSVSLRQDN